MSLITCCSGKDDAVGTQVVLCRPRRVNCITQVGVDKVGLNWLLVPYQHPLPSTNHHSSSSNMPRVTNTYTVPFDPIHNGPGELATAKEKYNLQ